MTLMKRPRRCGGNDLSALIGSELVRHIGQVPAYPSLYLRVSRAPYRRAVEYGSDSASFFCSGSVLSGKDSDAGRDLHVVLTVER